MINSTDNQSGQGTTRRAFLKQMLTLTSVSAGAALLNACGAGTSSTTATAVPPAAQQPTALATSAPAATTAATAEAIAGAATTSEATAQATTTGAATAEATTTAGSTTAQNTTPAIVAAANAFLATLDSSQKSSVLFDWSNTAQKQRWSNLPQGLFSRAGLMWGDLSAAQQNAWLPVMQATLSAEGYNSG